MKIVAAAQQVRLRQAIEKWREESRACTCALPFEVSLIMDVVLLENQPQALVFAQELLVGLEQHRDVVHPQVFWIRTREINRAVRSGLIKI